MSEREVRVSRDWRDWPLGTGIVAGLLVGLVIGVLADSLGVWIAVGITFGALLDGANQARRGKDGSGPER